MSFLSKVFSRKKDGKTPTTSQVILQFRENEDMLIKKQEYLEKKIEQEINFARKHGSQNKRASIQALKRKKRYEKQLQQIDGTLSTIEMQREALECAHTNTTVLHTMKSAADALKEAQRHMAVDQVRDVMDEIAEQQDVAREMSDVISNPVAFGRDEVEDEELERELEELENEELAKELLRVGPTGAEDLPSPPTAVLRSVSKKRSKEMLDEELKDMISWAS